MTGELVRVWAENVKAQRLARKWTQLELAEAVGVEHPTVSRWEKGQMAPTDSHKIAIAEAFQVDVRTLFPLVRSK